MTIEQYIDSCPNHFNGRRSNIPDVIVLHNTGGNKMSSAHYWFLDKESQTSAHYLVGLDGEVRQYVSLADGSYCNGTTTDETKKHYYKNATNGVVKTRPQNANLYTVTIEFVGNVGADLTEPQFEAAVVLIKYIIGELKRIYNKDFPINRLHIIGHYEIAPLTRGSCGKGISYNKIIKRLTEVPVDPYVSKFPKEPETNPSTSDMRGGLPTSIRRNIIK